MRKKRNKCELVSYEGKWHAFFNGSPGDEEFDATMEQVVSFLRKWKFLPEE